MKKLKLVLLMIISIFALTGCGSEMTDTADRIVRPENKAAPLQGTWKLEECYDRKIGEQTRPETAGRLMGTEVGFNADIMVFGDKYWNNVRYKVRKVDAEEYFLHKYPDALTRFDIREKEVLVVTASSEEKFLYEFVKAADDRYIVDVEEEYYCMRKTSEKFSGLPAMTAALNLAGSGVESPAAVKIPRSGLLLAFRVPAAANTNKAGQATVNCKYVTYWISSIDSVIRPVYSTENIFLPRKDGFWWLEISKALNSEGIEDILTASMVPNSNVRKALPSSDTGNAAKRIETKLEKAILYVGNDYVCVENTIHRTKQGGSGTYLEKVLRTLPVDNLKKNEGIRFSDLTGENGIMAMENAAAEALGPPTSNVIGGGADKLQEENFALFRKTGHWFFKGRVSLSQNDPMSYVEYNINLIPPPDMVAYDMLHVPWTAVKDKAPKAIDAYTSPNKDIAVVITDTEIILYAIKEGALSEKPLKKFAVADGSSVIMAEWATGDYVQNWEKAFLKINTAKLVP